MQEPHKCGSNYVFIASGVIFLVYLVECLQRNVLLFISIYVCCFDVSLV